MSLLRSLLAAAALASACPALLAETLSYSFSGVVDWDQAARGYLQFEGSFSLDSATPDLWTQSNSDGRYVAAAPANLSLRFDGGAWLVGDSGFELQLRQDLLQTFDHVQVAGSTADGQYQLYLALDDASMTALNGDTLAELTGSGLQLTRYGAAYISLGGPGNVYLGGHLEQLSCTAGCGAPLPAVPEPGAPLLLVLGLTGLTLMRRLRG